MNIKNVLAIVAFLICANISLSSALTCYECTQPKGNGLPCETNVESVEQIVCPVGYNTCVKYVWTTLGSSVVSRHCASLNYCELLSQNSTSFNTLELCQQCETELCNSGITFRTSVFLWTFLVVSVAMVLI